LLFVFIRLALEYRMLLPSFYEPASPLQHPFTELDAHYADASYLRSINPVKASFDTIPVMCIPVNNGAADLLRLVKSIDFPVKRLLIHQDGSVARVTSAIEKIKRRSFGGLIEEVVHVSQPARSGVAQGWNSAVRLFPRMPFWIIVGSDIMFPPGQLLHFYRQVLKREADHSISVLSPSCQWGSCGYGAFALYRNTVLQVGVFDENIFPAYYEDDDYNKRASLVGLHYEHTSRSQVVHGYDDSDGRYVSGSVRIDAMVGKENDEEGDGEDELEEGMGFGRDGGKGDKRDKRRGGNITSGESGRKQKHKRKLEGASQGQQEGRGAWQALLSRANVFRYFELKWGLSSFSARDYHNGNMNGNRVQQGQQGIQQVRTPAEAAAAAAVGRAQAYPIPPAMLVAAETKSPFRSEAWHPLLPPLPVWYWKFNQRRRECAVGRLLLPEEVEVGAVDGTGAHTSEMDIEVQVRAGLASGPFSGPWYADCSWYDRVPILPELLRVDGQQHRPLQQQLHPQLLLPVVPEDTQAGVGSGWVLVRRVVPPIVSPYIEWFQASDDCAGIDFYGSDTSAAMSAQNRVDGSFSFKFSGLEYEEVLFSLGDMRQWMVIRREELARLRAHLHLLRRAFETGLWDSGGGAYFAAKARASSPLFPVVVRVERSHKRPTGPAYVTELTHLASDPRRFVLTLHDSYPKQVLYAEGSSTMSADTLRRHRGAAVWVR
jgi:hypothetical protein